MISCPNSYMMAKAKWLCLCSYKTSLPCLIRKMDVLMKRPACCLHTHFVNPHNSSAEVCLLAACTHLSSFVISLNLLFIIFIQNLLTINYYKNGRPRMNCLWIFGSASVICSLKLRKARLSSHIFGIDSSTILTNQSIPRRSLSPSPVQHTSVMELHNH